MCDHEAFVANVAVDRLKDRDDGDVNAFAATVTIHCTDCGEAFCFLGLPGGLHPEKPTVSVDETEARLPICPVNEGNRRPHYSGFTVKEIVNLSNDQEEKIS